MEEPRSPLLAEAIRQLDAYFAGERHSFELPLDWSLISGFNREVLRELASTVPFGTVVGYGDLAGRVGQPGAAQAVGMAMGANPLPVVVPCPVTGWWRAGAASAGSGRAGDQAAAARPGGCAAGAAVLTPP